MLDDFMIRASLGGVGVALAAAPLGALLYGVGWHIFGEATAHFALLGIALSLTFEFSIFAGAILVGLMLSSLVTMYEGRTLFLDTLLGVAGHTSIALGLVIISFISGIRIDLMAYLIGDILAVSRLDLLFIWLGAGIIFVLIFWRWSSLLLMTLNEDLASASGIHPKKGKFYSNYSSCHSCCGRDKSSWSTTDNFYAYNSSGFRTIHCFFTRNDGDSGIFGRNVFRPIRTKRIIYI